MNVLTKFCKSCYSDGVRRHYKISININRRKFDEVIVDPHFEIKHSKSINDEVVLSLVQNLDGRQLEASGVDSEGFLYFVTEPMFYKGKPYRLVWLIDPADTYIGVINCFRRPKK